MATAARDRLASTLRGDAKTAFSVELTATTDDLLHSRIDTADALFAREQEARDRNHADLGWLAETARTPKFGQSSFEDR